MWTVNNESKLATKYGQVSFGQRLTMPFAWSMVHATYFRLVKIRVVSFFYSFEVNGGITCWHAQNLLLAEHLKSIFVLTTSNSSTSIALKKKKLWKNSNISINLRRNEDRFNFNMVSFRGNGHVRPTALTDFSCAANKLAAQSQKLPPSVSTRK